jgi:hypothetical protein
MITLHNCNDRILGHDSKSHELLLKTGILFNAIGNPRFHPKVKLQQASAFLVKTN